MAEFIKLNQFGDSRGCLTVIEKQIPFDIKRVFYIEGASGYARGGHRHHVTIQALICLSGSCVISNNNGLVKEEFLLDDSGKCLLLQPEDWHIMHSFTPHAILLVLASTYYDQHDYIDAPYPDAAV